ncbi:hypothetical protein [Azospirillum largimobile]
MDLLKSLDVKISAIPTGDHSAGLQSILLHIETAFRHLQRGQEQQDDAAFTDVIYRTNQAFEGSIKEAFRVLAGKDPSHMRSYDIENYLENNQIFRDRVLKLFTNYRKEWRNPSTHDYKLDFDDGEALIAIVSVSAFCLLIVDQISERLSYNSMVSEIEVDKLPDDIHVKVEEKLADQLATTLKDFGEYRKFMGWEDIFPTTRQIIGAVNGIISKIMPDVSVENNVRLGASNGEFADILLYRGDDRLVVQIRRVGKASQGMNMSVFQLERCMNLAGINQGLIFIYKNDTTEYNIEKLSNGIGDGEITAVIPSASYVGKEWY